MDRLRTEGLGNRTNILNELGYTSFYRDRKNPNTALHKALKEYENEMLTELSIQKFGNLETIMKIRDDCIADGDPKNALAAAKMINEMMGHNAPKKTVNTDIKVETVIDLTRVPAKDDFGNTIYDVEATIEE